MIFAPTVTERLMRAKGDLRAGLPVVLHHPQSGGALIAAVETLGAARLAALRGLGAAEVVISSHRARTLKAHAYDEDLARITIRSDADMKWLRAVADPSDDLSYPMKGPFHALRGGDTRFQRAALHLTKYAHLLPAAVIVAVPDAAEFATAHGLTCLDLHQMDTAQLHVTPLHSVVTGRVPMAAAQAGRVHVFRPQDGGEEHYAIEIGNPPRNIPVLARLHSACFTGDVLGSLKCDCGAQLGAALAQMNSAGAGVLLYLNQEGRGIGLANKMRAYSLQDQGFDTVEANHRLGFEDDERDFHIGADMLRGMGFSEVKLLTNNPRKVDMLTRYGIKVVTRVPLNVGRTEENQNYLSTKVAKSGHIL